MLDLENRIAHLEGVVRAQNENLKHWRAESDRDAGIIARLKSELYKRKHQPFEYDQDEPSFEDRVAAWVTTRIGPEHMQSAERAMRLLEEAMELAQAEGIDIFKVVRQASHVFSRESGDATQEAGGVAVCLLAWCSATGQKLEDVALREIMRIEAKPLQDIRESLARKQDADLVTVTREELKRHSKQPIPQVFE